MANKKYLIYLAAVPYVILALIIIVHWNVYDGPLGLKPVFNSIIAIFTFSLFIIIGVLLAFLYNVPRSVLRTKEARVILAVNVVVQWLFWLVYFSGIGKMISDFMLFFVRVQGF